MKEEKGNHHDEIVYSGKKGYLTERSVEVRVPNQESGERKTLWRPQNMGYGLVGYMGYYIGEHSN